MSGLFPSSASSTTPSQGDLSKDIEVKQPPSDSVSQISFSSTGDFLAVSSWDNKVRVYGVDPNTGTSEGKTMFEFQGPVLSVAWSMVRILVMCNVLGAC